MRQTLVPGLLVGLLVFLAAGCGSTTGTPTPTQRATTAAPQQTTAAPAAGAPRPEKSATWVALGRPDLSKEGKRYHMTWLATGGVTAYFAGIYEATRVLLRDRAPEITFEVVDTARIERVQLLAREPDKWASGTYLYSFAPGDADIMARGLWPEGDAPRLSEPGLMAYPNAPMSCIILLTLDPSIKTIFDLRGKTVEIGSKGDTYNYYLRAIFDANDIQVGREVNIAAPSEQVLADRRADADSTGIIGCEGLSAGILDLAAREKVYLVDFTKEGMEKAYAKYGWVQLTPFKMCGRCVREVNNLNYDMVQDPSGFIWTPVGTEIALYVHENAPVWGIYWLNKLMIENVDILTQYMPQVHKIFKYNYGSFAGEPDDFHPGMRIAMEEAGIIYGTDGINAYVEKFYK